MKKINLQLMIIFSLFLLLGGPHTQAQVSSISSLESVSTSTPEIKEPSEQKQGKIALTITPPIIKNNVSPGQIWKSYIKVVNNNDADIDAYVQLVNFESDGETGTVKLNPMDEAAISANEFLINNWVIIEKGPIKVPANKSTEIPFIVDVPEQVDPGDHHVAILIGTKPNDSGGQGSSIKVASMIGSLLLLNVSGDVNEKGEIREFSKDKNLYSTGDVNFTLRFQNTGNTILQPQGEIKIFDFKNNEKGSVLINQKTNTGNVFPDDIRRWDYTWPVPKGLMDMGRYRAEMTLEFGGEAKESAKQAITFWVIQWKPLLIAFSIFISILLIIILMVRRYVRNAIESTQEQLGIKKNDLVNQTRAKASDGLQAVVDLKVKQHSHNPEPRKKKVAKKSRGMLFVSTFIIIIAFIITFAIFLFLYITTKEETIIPLKEVNEQSVDYK